jgi:uncharacterized SAM-binding protein YcdF (DUF218 family)
VAATVVVDTLGRARRPLDWSAPTAVVVLGARVNPDGQPSDTLRARLAHGVELVRQAPGAVLLISGGLGDFPPSEAEAGRRFALAAGLAPERIVLEDRSHSTRENAACSAPRLSARGYGSVVLVSDPYHLPRARLEFERHGLRVQTSPVLAAPRHRRWDDRAWWSFREVLLIGSTLVRGLAVCPAA